MGPCPLTLNLSQPSVRNMPWEAARNADAKTLYTTTEGRTCRAKMMDTHALGSLLCCCWCSAPDAVWMVPPVHLRRGGRLSFCTSQSLSFRVYKKNEQELGWIRAERAFILAKTKPRVAPARIKRKFGEAWLDAWSEEPQWRVTF